MTVLHEIESMLAEIESMLHAKSEVVVRTKSYDVRESVVVQIAMLRERRRTWEARRETALASQNQFND